MYANRLRSAARLRADQNEDGGERILSTKPLLEAFKMGAWWDVRILSQNQNNFLIHYEGFGKVEDEEIQAHLMRMRTRKAQVCDCKKLQRDMDIVVFVLHPHAIGSRGLSQLSAWYDAKIISKDQKSHYCGCTCKFTVQLYSEKNTDVKMGKERSLLNGTTMDVKIGKVGVLQVPITTQILGEVLSLPETSPKKNWSIDSFSLNCSFFFDGHLEPALASSQQHLNTVARTASQEGSQVQLRTLHSPEEKGEVQLSTLHFPEEKGEEHLGCQSLENTLYYGDFTEDPHHRKVPERGILEPMTDMFDDRSAVDCGTSSIEHGNEIEQGEYAVRTRRNLPRKVKIYKQGRYAESPYRPYSTRLMMRKQNEGECHYHENRDSLSNTMSTNMGTNYEEQHCLVTSSASLQVYIDVSSSSHAEHSHSNEEQWYYHERVDRSRKKKRPRVAKSSDNQYHPEDNGNPPKRCQTKGKNDDHWQSTETPNGSHNMNEQESFSSSSTEESYPHSFKPTSSEQDTSRKQCMGLQKKYTDVMEPLLKKKSPRGIKMHNKQFNHLSIDCSPELCQKGKNDENWQCSEASDGSCELRRTNGSFTSSSIEENYVCSSERKHDEEDANWQGHKAQEKKSLEIPRPLQSKFEFIAAGEKDFHEGSNSSFEKNATENNEIARKVYFLTNRYDNIQGKFSQNKAEKYRQQNLNEQEKVSSCPSKTHRNKHLQQQGLACEQQKEPNTFCEEAHDLPKERGLNIPHRPTVKNPSVFQGGRQARTSLEGQKRHKSSRMGGTKENKKFFDEIFEEIIKSARGLGATDWEKLLQRENKEDKKEECTWDPIVFHEEEDSKVETFVDEDPLRNMWHDMDMCIEIGNQSEKMKKAEAAQTQEDGECDKLMTCDAGHDLVLDEKEGLVCTACGLVLIQIEKMFPPLIENKLHKHRVDHSAKVNCTKNDFVFVSNDDKETQLVMNASTTTNGSQKRIPLLWGLIPDLKVSMRPHQIDGFEFLWRNIGGGHGGCIISHAPGTGKSLLVISFLKSYLLLNSWCRPLIVAPRNMLLPWQREFKKWRATIPVHILNRREIHPLSQMACGTTDMSYSSAAFYYLSIISNWQRKESVLILSYQLFSRLTDENNARLSAESKKIGSLLLNIPGLLILDEGHLPRNQKSKMRKSLLRVSTKLRILLSGTLFQNNVQELFNSLYLAKPTFMDNFQRRPCERFQMLNNNIRAEMRTFQELENKEGRVSISQREEEAEIRARKLFMKEVGTELESMKEQSFKASIDTLRAITSSFLHYHAGEVLDSLPGIKEFTIVLKTSSCQEDLLNEVAKISNPLSSLEQELIETSVLIHPCLFAEYDFAKKYKSIDIVALRKSRRDPQKGSKVNFLLDLADVCKSANENLLIFSQNIPPLLLLEQMLQNKFEVFRIQGGGAMEKKQMIIDSFNEAKGTKILLASMRACAEGITLTGASRVVFIEMHWNPALMKQAVSRAFRLGQDKVVHVYRLIASGTMEGNKYMKTVRKDRLSRSIFTSTTETVACNESVSMVAGEDWLLDQLINMDTSQNILQIIKHKAFLEEGNFSTRFGYDGLETPGDFN